MELTKEQIETANEFIQEKTGAWLGEENLPELARILQYQKPTELTDEHVAWCCYKHHDGEGETTIHLCDSDREGAFKVYRRHCDYANCSLPYGHIQSCNEAEPQPAEPSPAPSGDVKHECLDTIKLRIAIRELEAARASRNLAVSAREAMLAHPPAEWSKSIEGMMHCEKHGIYWDEELGELCSLCVKDSPSEWLKDPTPIEVSNAEDIIAKVGRTGNTTWAAQCLLNQFCERRRARLTAQPQQRVTVVGAVVYMDGKEHAVFKGHDSHEPAERYAAGLRAELEKEAEGGKA